MATKHNFMLKVVDARMSDVRKVLKDAGINLVSIIEVHKEELPGEKEAAPAAEGEK
jgi:hypothetical protein